MGNQIDWCCKHVAINHKADLLLLQCSRPRSLVPRENVMHAMQGGGFAACALGLLCVFQEKLVRLLAKCCGRSLCVLLWQKMSTQSSSSVPMLQIYVPRLPGLPSGFSYLPNRFGLQYEVRRACQQVLGSLCRLALQDGHNADVVTEAHAPFLDFKP